MVQTVDVTGLSSYKEEVAKHKDKTVFALFTGSPDSSGKSWCPDCVRADGVIHSALSKAPNDAVFINCLVGERAVWKDPNNEFRKEPTLMLKGVPTLIKVGTKNRLVEAECAKEDLVTMLFTED
ncbi:thioredoxin domain-containing protein 17-like [Liolophura sinensis]|uniref:thioredoxin domain-containing protein 17-like n=1 Tax=Liolophura sinensis TaxID=3198878 RepID=UPI0031581426